MKRMWNAALVLALASCMQREVRDEAPVSQPATFAEQVEVGAKTYAQNCSRCHGDSGEGSKKGPRIVGLELGALPLDPPPGAKQRKEQFRTVADINRFVVRYMPPLVAGELPAQSYWNILAFDLKANGIELDRPLDAQLAETLEIPRPQRTSER